MFILQIIVYKIHYSHFHKFPALCPFCPIRTDYGTRHEPGRTLRPGRHAKQEHQDIRIGRDRGREGYIGGQECLPAHGRLFGFGHLQRQWWVSDRDFSNGQTFASPHFGNSFSIEASQVIFAGGSIHHQVKALEAQQKIAEWDLAAHRQEVYFLLTGYYLDLYKYRNLLTVYDRNIEQTLQVIRDMRAREAAGVALDNDITRY